MSEIISSIIVLINILLNVFIVLKMNKRGKEIQKQMDELFKN